MSKWIASPRKYVKSKDTPPYCARCQCPLTRLLKERKYRTLCVRCHEHIGQSSVRNKTACVCADIGRCKSCYAREVRHQMNRRESAASEELYAD